ncbi:MAG: DUF2851 family protein [Luteibaculum sp.]
MQINEKFLAFIWKQQKFKSLPLKSTDGDIIEVLKPGIPNHDAGPDFLMAQIRINGRLWSGSVELHVNSSDWLLHGHDGDKKYENLILHLIWREDVKLKNPNCPTVICENIVPENILQTYYQLQSPYQSIPCESHLTDIDDFIKAAWLNRMLVERLEKKIAEFQSDYLSLQSNLNESFYRLMAKAFGQKVNQTGFELLSRHLPLNILLRHANKLQEVEALLFGVSGFLQKPEDEYSESLANHFKHFQRKYDLTTIPESSWNFLRLRPANFPTVRIAQFAALINRSEQFLSLPTQSPNFEDLENLLRVKASEYWDTHYNFHKSSDYQPKWISSGFFRHLVVNVFVPFVFFYKRRTGAVSFEWVEDVMSATKKEDNKITRLMEAAGFKNESSKESQALYHLYNDYCSKSKCLSCAIGSAVLNEIPV